MNVSNQRLVEAVDAKLRDISQLYITGWFILYPFELWILYYNETSIKVKRIGTLGLYSSFFFSL